MSDPQSITADAFEILVTRELRRAGVEPIALRRHGSVKPLTGGGFTFDLFGRLEAYDHRWPALIECRNAQGDVKVSDIDDLQQRAHVVKAGSALLFATADFARETCARAHQLHIAVLRVVDAKAAFQTEMMMGEQLPMWLPEFTAQLIWQEGGESRIRSLEAGDPELILERLRP